MSFARERRALCSACANMCATVRVLPCMSRCRWMFSVDAPSAGWPDVVNCAPQPVPLCVTSACAGRSSTSWAAMRGCVPPMLPRPCAAVCSDDVACVCVASRAPGPLSLGTHAVAAERRCWRLTKFVYSFVSSLIRSHVRIILIGSHVRIILNFNFATVSFTVSFSFISQLIPLHRS